MAIFRFEACRRLIMNEANISYHNLYNTIENDTSEVLDGLLNKQQKKISSKFFYDETGSILFDKITKLKDYYPTHKEMEILEDNSKEFHDYFPSNSSVIEFGSGSNKKIKKLLKSLKKPCEYVPIDISKDFLFKNALHSAKHFPNLKVKAICADFNQIQLIKKFTDNKKKKIGFFPGSTIGNYCPDEAQKLLKSFSMILGKNNYLIVGVDLKKDKKIIERAYNDSEGVTELFNKNILNGINKKFNTYFDSDNFNHKAFFNNEESRVEMHLVSNRNHSVNFMNNRITFKVGETIHTENSYKYSIEDFRELVGSAKMEIKKVLKDKESFFGIFFLKVISF